MKKETLIIDCTTNYQPDTFIPPVCKRCNKFHYEGVKLGITNPCQKIRVLNNWENEFDKIWFDSKNLSDIRPNLLKLISNLLEENGRNNN